MSPYLSQRTRTLAEYGEALFEEAYIAVQQSRIASGDAAREALMEKAREAHRRGAEAFALACRVSVH